MVSVGAVCVQVLFAHIEYKIERPQYILKDILNPDEYEEITDVTVLVKALTSLYYKNAEPTNKAKGGS